MPKSPRARQVSKADAMVRFVEAVIVQIGSKPPADISDQLIADTAGMNRASLYRYFGTRFGLFDAAAAELARRWLIVAETTVPVGPSRDGPPMSMDSFGPLFELSSKLFAIGGYLVTEDYRSDQVSENFTRIVDTWISQYETAGIAPRMARALAHKNLGLNLARPMANPLVNLPIEDVLDVYALTLSEIRNFETMQSDLGWDRDSD